MREQLLNRATNRELLPSDELAPNAPARSASLPYELLATGAALAGADLGAAAWRWCCSRLAAPQLADLVKYAPHFLPGVLAFILMHCHGFIRC